MPKVGKKHFSYDKKGRKKAKAYAKKTGKEVRYSEGRKVKVRGTGAATKGLYARGPMA
jgi:hypothetical protein|tara:strand:+ start:106 stop:279 length:174 start_codon:yes stop_codon:yes gene_type:complete